MAKFIAIGPYCWGEGETLAQAAKRALVNWPRYSIKSKPARAGLDIYFTEDDGAQVTELGGIRYKRDLGIKQVQEAKTPKRD